MDAHYYVDDSTPTGTCAVLVNSGDRSLVANLAAANNFTPEHLDTEKAKAMVDSAKFFYIASFFLTVSVDAILKIAKPAAESGKVGTEQEKAVQVLLWRLAGYTGRSFSVCSSGQLVVAVACHSGRWSSLVTCSQTFIADDTAGGRRS